MTASEFQTAIGHLPAILLIAGTIALYAFYALLALAGVVLAVDWVLELAHRMVARITR